MSEPQDKRAAVRARAAAIRKAQQRREKRNKILLITGVLAFIAIIAAAIFAIVTGNDVPPNEVDAVPSTVQEETGGIPVGAGLVAGTENEGAPVVEVYLDVTCSYCNEFENINYGVIEDLVNNEEATVVYHPLSILDQSGTRLAGFSGRSAHALAVVADQSPEHFMQFMQGLFNMYHNAQSAPVADFKELATSIGISNEVADSLNDGQFNDWINAKNTKFIQDGFSGTPTVLINGNEFNNWITPGALADAVRTAGELEVGTDEGGTIEPGTPTAPPEGNTLPEETEEATDGE